LVLIKKIFTRFRFYSTLTARGHTRQLHERAPVQLHDFVLIGAQFFDEPKKIIASLGDDQKSPLLVKGEFYPLFYNSNAKTLDLLREVVKVTRPSCVVETGVANGISTGVALSALNHTGGVLHSFDILASCANLFPDAQNWNFHLLNLKKAPAELAGIVSNIQEIDLWIHDADHGTTWQRMEFALGTKKLKAGGLLISDDADASPAWGEMSKKLTHKSAILLDRRKIIGITPKLA
jgi:hypothetical protein